MTDPITTLEQLIDHIEGVHEYEDPARTERELRTTHANRHRNMVGAIEHAHPGIKNGDDE